MSAGSAPMPPARRRGRPDGPGNPAARSCDAEASSASWRLWAGEGRAPAFSRGRSGRRRARPATAPGNSFPPARTRAFAARSKRAAGRRPALRCGPDGAPHATCRMGTPGCRPAPPPAFGRHEGRGGRGLPNPEPPMLDDLLSHPVPADTDDDAAQSPPPPFTRSTNWRSMAAGPSRTTPTRGPCPSRTPPKARSPAPSMPSPICSAAPGSKMTCPTCSGPSSTCSTARPTGSRAISTTTSRRNAAPKPSRTAPRSSRSTWSA